MQMSQLQPRAMSDSALHTTNQPTHKDAAYRPPTHLGEVAKRALVEALESFPQIWQASLTARDDGAGGEAWLLVYVADNGADLGPRVLAACGDAVPAGQVMDCVPIEMVDVELRHRLVDCSVPVHQLLFGC